MVLSMRYMSTRGAEKDLSFLETLTAGLASDRGLFVPEEYPTLSEDDLDSLRDSPYSHVAASVLSLFSDDLSPEEIGTLARKTYSPETFAEDITPIERLDTGFHLQDLSSGPTLAFKDMALQLLGNLFEHVVKEGREYINIVGASSGDTVSAAEQGVVGREGVNIFMLTPHGRMSRFQAAQAYSIIEPNVFNIAIEGNFDDGQDIAKDILRDPEMRERYHVTAANSINWGRIAAQVMYYAQGYLSVTESTDQEVDFAVPSGNFGNVLAGYIAKQMGVPIRRLVVATNENNVLDTFFRTGVYRRWDKDQVHRTESPSMDISKASNLERVLLDVFDRDPDLTRQAMERFEDEAVLDVRNTRYEERLDDLGFVSGTSTREERRETIKDIYASTGRVIDPHTAAGIFVGQDYKSVGVPMICMETAKPHKFEEAVAEAIGEKNLPPRPTGFENLETKPKRYEILPADRERIQAYVVEHALTE